ncbi:MAG: peptidyl-prolyl cis-trans isomerase [Myxococcales bacterium]|nr:MAG: peptidyl-prolyl cis-trans isomerase [Myxococcales bacterium]
MSALCDQPNTMRLVVGTVAWLWVAACAAQTHTLLQSSQTESQCALSPQKLRTLLPEQVLLQYLAALSEEERMHYQSPLQKAQLRCEMAVERLLSTEAKRRHLDRNAKVKRGYQQLLARTLSEQEFSVLADSEISDAEVNAYYEAHQEEFIRPPKRRARFIILDSPIKARRVLGLALRASDRGFAQLARRMSDDRRNRNTKGKGPWMYPDNNWIDPAIVAAAFALEKEGQIWPKPVQLSDERFAVVRLVGIGEAEEMELDEVADAIRSRIRHETLQKTRRQFLKKLAD